MNHGNFQQGHKCFRQISRLCARLAGKNPSNGYPNKLVAPLSGTKKIKNLEQWRTKQQFSWEMNLQHSTLFLIKKIILFYDHLLKGGILLDFPNFKRKLYEFFLDKFKSKWEGHKIWKNLPPVLTKQLFLLSRSVKASGIFFQIFVAFSEKLDFKGPSILCTLRQQKDCAGKFKTWQFLLTFSSVSILI